MPEQLKTTAEQRAEWRYEADSMLGVDNDNVLALLDDIDTLLTRSADTVDETMLGALTRIAEGAPTEDPGTKDGYWGNEDDAENHGWNRASYFNAEIARKALSTLLPNEIKCRSCGADTDADLCATCKASEIGVAPPPGLPEGVMEAAERVADKYGGVRREFLEEVLLAAISRGEAAQKESEGVRP